MVAGNYIPKFVDDYCVMDTETTGLDPRYCELIDISIMKVRNGMIVDEYNHLMKPKKKINSFITNLTGITNEMVEDQPHFNEISEEIFSFLDGEFLIGQNLSFDLRFLSTLGKRDIHNQYSDTMILGRRLLPNLAHHRLQDLCEYYQVTPGTHRAKADTFATYQVYEAEKKTFHSRNVSEEELFGR